MLLFLIISVPTYLILRYLLNFNDIWAVPVALLIAIILTYNISRRSWERKILNGLTQQQQDFFFRSIGIGNAKGEQMLEEGANRPDMLKHVMISTVDGLVDLSESEKSKVLAMYEQHGNNPFSHSFVLALDVKFNSRYSEKFDGFVSRNHGENLTTSIPFSRMYKWVMKLNSQFIDNELKAR